MYCPICKKLMEFDNEYYSEQEDCWAEVYHCGHCRNWHTRFVIDDKDTGETEESPKFDTDELPF